MLFILYGLLCFYFFFSGRCVVKLVERRSSRAQIEFVLENRAFYPPCRGIVLCIAMSEEWSAFGIAKKPEGYRPP